MRARTAAQRKAAFAAYNVYNTPDSLFLRRLIEPDFDAPMTLDEGIETIDRNVARAARALVAEEG